MRRLPTTAGRRRYRSSGKQASEATAPRFDARALDEALRLLETNDYASLKRAKPKHVRGELTWARLASTAAATIADRLVALRDPGELSEAAEQAQELAARLDARDATRDARTTAATRDAIKSVAAVGTTLLLLTRLRDGKLAPAKLTLDEGGRVLALRQRYVRLGGAGNAFLRTLVEQASAKVLGSDAHGGVRSLFVKALQQWTPPPPEPAPPVSKRRKLADDPGERVEWDDDDF